jgi:hypothetical protein
MSESKGRAGGTDEVKIVYGGGGAGGSYRSVSASSAEQARKLREAARIIQEIADEIEGK